MGAVGWGIARWLRFVRLVACVALGAFAAAPVRADGHTAVASFGVFGAEPGEDQAALLDLELRFPVWRWSLGPVVGVGATEEGTNYLRAGVGRDYPLGERWNVNLGLAASGYVRGGGKDLGLGLEFRSAIDVSYQWRPGLRLGVALAHLSNAGLGEVNPGVEALTFTVAVLPRR